MWSQKGGRAHPSHSPAPAYPDSISLNITTYTAAYSTIALYRFVPVQGIFKDTDLAAVGAGLRKLYDEGYPRSLTIVLIHSYTFPDHGCAIGKLARSLGATHVSELAQLLTIVKMVPRDVSSTDDAHLTPILCEYLDGFINGVDAELKDGRLRSLRVSECMGSGGLLDLNSFLGAKSTLTGPVGSVVGSAQTSRYVESKILISDWTLAGPKLISPNLSEDMKLFTKTPQQ